MKHFSFSKMLLSFVLFSFAGPLCSMELVETGGGDTRQCDGTIRLDPHVMDAYYVREETHRSWAKETGMSSHQIFPFVTVEIARFSNHNESKIGVYTHSGVPISFLFDLKSNDYVMYNSLRLRCIGNEGQETSFEQDLENKIESSREGFLSYNIPSEILNENSTSYDCKLIEELINNQIINEIRDTSGTCKYTWGKNGIVSLEQFRLLYMNLIEQNKSEIFMDDIEENESKNCLEEILDIIYKLCCFGVKKKYESIK